MPIVAAISARTLVCRSSARPTYREYRFDIISTFGCGNQILNPVYVYGTLSADRDGVRPRTPKRLARFMGDNASYAYGMEFAASRACARCDGSGLRRRPDGCTYGDLLPDGPIGDAYPSGLMDGMLEVRSGYVFVSRLTRIVGSYSGLRVTRLNSSRANSRYLTKAAKLSRGRASVCASVVGKRIRGRLADRARPSVGQRT
jgi:hypothetical protein